jgi:hypothetical protein
VLPNVIILMLLIISVVTTLEQDPWQSLQQGQGSTPVGMLHALFVLYARNCWLT